MTQLDHNGQKALLRLKEALWEWLVINELELDTGFYSTDEWRKRGEEWLNDAELVFVFEGGLHTMLNFGGDTNVFDDFVGSFGFYYEMGHSWNMGFYPLENYKFQPLFGSYSNKLRDNRWIAKSNLVKSRAENKCQDCGSYNNLEAHHSYYQQTYKGF